VLFFIVAADTAAITGQLSRPTRQG